MKKKLLGLALVGGAAALALASCGPQHTWEGWDDWDDVDTGTSGGTTATVTPAAADAGYTKNNSGDKFVIYVWNAEFRGFFNKYLTDEGKANQASTDAEAKKKWNDNHAGDKTGLHYKGTEVVFIENTNEGGVYQQKLDLALDKNEEKAEDKRVDLFLAEADYILKYTQSKVTNNIANIGVTAEDQADTYNYTVAAAANGNVVKGVSFQCCPSGMIYRRSIAKALFGTDDPTTVQSMVDTWDKWEAVAKDAKAQGYYMTASYADSYRVFTNNSSTPWVDANDNLTLPKAVKRWMRQAKDFVKEGYTKTDGVWDSGKTDEFTKDGKAFCTFGPAWYYNFCMTPAMGDSSKAETDPINVNKTYGDWAVVKGPQAHFWGGTWALAAKGGSNDDLVASVMKEIIGNDFSKAILENEGQFSNNKTANAAYAATGKGNGFLNGQNDTALWVSMADDIKFQNITTYDQLCNEDIQTEFVKYLKKTKGYETKDAAINGFYSLISKAYPTLKIA